MTRAVVLRNKAWNAQIGRSEKACQAFCKSCTPAACSLSLQEFKKHHILNEMAGLRISRSKKVTFDIKVTIEISCLMDFSDYPFDEHTCNFQVTSSVLFPNILLSSSGNVSVSPIIFRCFSFTDLSNFPCGPLFDEKNLHRPQLAGKILPILQTLNRSELQDVCLSSKVNDGNIIQMKTFVCM